jgi:hypothetical protein
LAQRARPDGRVIHMKPSGRLRRRRCGCQIRPQGDPAPESNTGSAEPLAAQLSAAQLLAAELDASDRALSPPQYEEPAVQEFTFVRDRGNVGNLHVVQVGPAFFDDPPRV